MHPKTPLNQGLAGGKAGGVRLAGIEGDPHQPGSIGFISRLGGRLSDTLFDIRQHCTTITSFNHCANLVICCSDLFDLSHSSHSLSSR